MQKLYGLRIDFFFLPQSSLCQWKQFRTKYKAMTIYLYMTVFIFYCVHCLTIFILQRN